MKAALALGLSGILATSLAVGNTREKDTGFEHEMYVDTDSGSIVLTEDKCPVENQFGFTYLAYATEKLPDGKKVLHQGCWYVDKDKVAVSIWFYNEDPSLVATYSTKYFKARDINKI